jgi:hypothetical protein
LTAISVTNDGIIKIKSKLILYKSLIDVIHITGRMIVCFLLILCVVPDERILLLSITGMNESLEKGKLWKERVKLSLDTTDYYFLFQIFHKYFLSYFSKLPYIVRSRRDRDRMEVGFSTTCSYQH